jgi:hypothetical protein
MKVFHCDRCRHLLFFENSYCVSCDATLAFVPEHGMLALEPCDAEHHRPLRVSLRGQLFRLCRNYREYQTCNWALPVDDGHAYCRSCRLTRTVPDLSDARHRVAWFKLETAKRRLVFTLLALRLPLSNREDDAVRGLAFDFKADLPGAAAAPVLTGHADGIITVNLGEADDVERELRRQNLGEPYRTALGHMRHESGHYYWDRLIRDMPQLEEFRTVFGDERPDYGEALNAHYTTGAPPDWPERFVSAYASAHPWEDWAETWAHYLHMVDALETAADNGLIVRPLRAEEPAMERLPATRLPASLEFERLISSWFSLTYVLNNLNRSLGLADGYPFVLSTPVVGKLRYVHETIRRNGSSGPESTGGQHGEVR